MEEPPTDKDEGTDKGNPFIGIGADDGMNQSMPKREDDPVMVSPVGSDNDTFIGIGRNDQASQSMTKKEKPVE